MELPSSVIVDAEDRTNFIPKHQGPAVLPNFALFSRLLRFAHKGPRTVIKDVIVGFSATHIQLLTDVLNVRNVLQESLEEPVLRQLENGEEVFINVLSPGGYEYTVAFLAVVALGAVVVPLSPDLPVQEAVYYVQKCSAVAVLTGSRCAQKGSELAEIINISRPPFQSIPIHPHVMKSPLSPGEVIISSDCYLDINRSGLVIFTSGTTGPPKGAVKRRGFLTEAPQAIIDAYELTPIDTMLHILPVHHATGIGINLLPLLLCGGCIEFRNGSFDAAWTWERWRQGGLTFFSGVPTIYMRMMQYFERNLAHLPTEQLDGYVKGARQFRALLCGTSALPRPLQQKWTKLRDGKRIITRYGATEFGTGFMVPISPASDIPETSVGTIPAGTELKLSNGDEGEVLIKSPSMISKYLLDPQATISAHDADGFFKTGDIAQKIGPYYFILGRASIDIIKSGGYKISALDIEREILGLPYISEVMVVGVEDDEFGQRVAAAVTLQDDTEGQGIGRTLSLERLRSDLRGTLAGYKMPTLLRVVEGLPKTATGKVMKKVLRGEMFPAEGHPDVQVWRKAGVEAPRL